MKAISIRQPWAWAIIHAGKDIENRSRATSHRGHLLIHAAKTMTRGEYDSAADFMIAIGVRPPPFDELQRGGIIGVVDHFGCVMRSTSQWFAGPYGYQLRNPKPLSIIPCKGQLGFFDVPLVLDPIHLCASDPKEPAL